MHTSSYVDYILDTLSPLGNIRARKMFGGYGVYKDTVFFALIIDDTLFSPPKETLSKTKKLAFIFYDVETSITYF